MGLFGFRKNSRQDSGISKMNYIEKNNYISSFILAAYNKLKNEEDEPVKAAMYITLNLIYRDSEKLSKNAYYIRATKTNDITAHNIFMEAGIAPFVIMLEFLEPDGLCCTSRKADEITPAPDAAMPWHPRAPCSGARVA